MGIEQRRRALMDIFASDEHIVSKHTGGRGSVISFSSLQKFIQNGEAVAIRPPPLSDFTTIVDTRTQ